METTLKQKNNKDAAARIKRINTAKKYGFLISILGLQLLNFVIFYIVQNASALVMAFQWKKPVTGETYWTLHAFKLMFEKFSTGGNEMLIALRNTFIYFGFSLIMIPIGFATSYFMYKKIWGYKVWRILFFLPSILSSVVWSMIYKQIVGVHGPIAPLVQQIHGLAEVPELLKSTSFALFTVLMYSFWLGIAGNFVIYQGTLTRIPDSVIEAGKLDGVGWLREFGQIIVPLVWPTLSTVLLLSLTGIFTASGNLLLLTGGGANTNSISFYIFQQVYGQAEDSTTFNLGSAIGMFFTLLTIPIVFTVRYFTNRVEDVQY